MDKVSKLFIKLLIVSVISFLPLSCVDTGTSSTYYETIEDLESSNKKASKLYIFRAKGQFSGAISGFPVYVDKKEVGKINDNETLIVNIEPGIHIIEVKDWFKYVGKKTATTSVNVKPNEIRFFILTLDNRILNVPCRARGGCLMLEETSQSIWKSSASEW